MWQAAADHIHVGQLSTVGRVTCAPNHPRYPQYPLGVAGIANQLAPASEPRTQEPIRSGAIENFSYN